MGLLAHQHQHTKARTARAWQVAMDTWELAPSRAEVQTLQPGLVDLRGQQQKNVGALALLPPP